MPQADAEVAARGRMAGVDLGGTKILAAIVDEEHRILGRSKRPTPAKAGGDAIHAAILDALGEAAGAAGIPLAEVAGIGVGSPGPLDTEAGVILYSANLAVKDFPLGPRLSEATGLPVTVRNDVRVGGYGEFRLGAGRGYRDLIAAFVGTGIGGCLIVDGRTIDGASGNAGEVGHIVVKARGPRCGCGNRGCVEALASRSAVIRRVEKAIKAGRPTMLKSRLDPRSERKLKSKDLAAALFAGDALATSEIRRSAHYLGLAMGSLINVIAPQRIILGGGLVEAIGQKYVDWVARSARRQAVTDPHRATEIVAGALGDDAGVLGASLIARETLAARQLLSAERMEG